MDFPCKIVPDLAKGVSRTTTSLFDISPQQSHALGTINTRTIAKKHQHVRLRLSASHSAVFFSSKKPARLARFQPKRTGYHCQWSPKSHIVTKNTVRQISTYDVCFGGLPMNVHLDGRRKSSFACRACPPVSKIIYPPVWGSLITVLL
jgi:hypothetical protein